MTIEKINPQLIQQPGANKKGARMKGMSTDSGFGSMLDAIGAMGSTATTAGQMYGGSNSSAVLSAAFSGIGAASGSLGGGGAYGASAGGGAMGGAPYLAAGMSTTGTGFKADSTTSSIGAGGLSSTSAISGADGMSQMDMINTMNANNLQLLELQAVMQNNMQSWNTKSNILSADNRARMSMIEKFTAR